MLISKEYKFWLVLVVFVIVCLFAYTALFGADNAGLSLNSIFTSISHKGTGVPVVGEVTLTPLEVGTQEIKLISPADDNVKNAQLTSMVNVDAVVPDQNINGIFNDVVRTNQHNINILGTIDSGNASAVESGNNYTVRDNIMELKNPSQEGYRQEKVVAPKTTNAASGLVKPQNVTAKAVSNFTVEGMTDYVPPTFSTSNGMASVSNIVMERTIKNSGIHLTPF